MLLALSTGSEILDWAIGIISVILGPPVVYGIWQWIKNIGVKAARNWVQIQCNTQDIVKLREELLDHIQKDAVEAAIIFGFIDVGEEAHIVTDHLGKTIFVSPAFCKMLRLTPEELINGAWKDLIHHDDKKRVLEQWNNFIQSRLPETRIQFRFDRMEGSNPIIKVVLKTVRKRVVIGGVERIVGLFRVITELEKQPSITTPPDTKELPSLPSKP